MVTNAEEYPKEDPFTYRHLDAYNSRRVAFYYCGGSEDYSLDPKTPGKVAGYL